VVLHAGGVRNLSFRAFLSAVWATPELRWRLTVAAGAGFALAFRKGFTTFLVCLGIALGIGLPAGYYSWRRNGGTMERPSKRPESN
jgi:hypothetical protein